MVAHEPPFSSTSEAQEILFGPGIQTPAQTSSSEDPATPTACGGGPDPAQDDSELQDCSVLSRAFAELLPPVVFPSTASPPRHLPRPRTAPATAPQSRPKSTRRAAKSSIPVSQRAQRRLVKELHFIAPKEPVTDQAVTEYLKMYQEPLPAKAIAEIRKATRLASKPVAGALAAVAASEAAASGEIAT
ncbi:hypothetical protein PR202_ga29610 [Eleusine coracana subsp. coracana]|uniref:Uncharacterized protein n=1 Tax=Eleusine coracana subsp. coracana TaxID=191504 RepID=A0AAV5DLK7_ELECO|nr:hypothetical protein PR202_ga29610 [Eleusine coracana subsp. coracana]